MMEGRRIRIDQSVAVRETVTVPQGHNSVVVRLQGHTWVLISTQAGEIVRERSPDSVIAFTLSPGTYLVQTGGKIEGVTTESFRQEPSLFERLQQGPPAFLSLTADAPDRHVVDGVGEIPADGTSYCTITVEKKDLVGTPLTGTAHQDELFLRHRRCHHG
jgi:hypothetical protein